MEITLLNTTGYLEALYGLGLSREITNQMTFKEFSSDLDKVCQMKKVAIHLSPKGLGHNKFLEHIIVYWGVRAPRSWWSQADTYRLSSKQSESTMYNIRKRKLHPSDFTGFVTQMAIDNVNNLIEQKASVEVIKDNLPEGYLQMREWVMSMKTVQNIYLQRHNHQLLTWQYFAQEMYRLLPLEFKDYLTKG